MQLQKIAADSLPARLKRHIGNIRRRKLLGKIVKLAQSLYVGNGLDIKNQYGCHARDFKGIGKLEFAGLRD